MQQAGTVAMLLPGAYYFLRELLMLNMACTLFRLTPEEAWRGVTVNAAKALGLSDRGTLAVGLRADLAVWDAEHPREMTYRFGHNPCRRVVVGGAEATLKGQAVPIASPQRAA